MAILRVDPWDPGYGSSLELELQLEDDPQQAVELDVEPVDWAPVDPPEVEDLPCCAFVDGVRRIDLRLFAEEASGMAPALAGSWACGVAWSKLPPSVDEIIVGRTLVVGGGLTHDDLTPRVGADELRYAFVGVAGTTPLDPINGLQNIMREAEAALAQRVFLGGAAELLVLDGPLTYFAEGPVVGMIKRQSRSYLPGDRATILTVLGSGQRTPLFLLGEQRLERYSWYTRLATVRPIDGAMTGVVRLEVATSIGLDNARVLADLTTAVLPRFASVVGRDPRAPQNLYPVGQLERVLRHRLGDAELIKRALELALWEAYV
ncbi:MAG: hypothetical protein WD359_02440 [Dehalococcoidia bacterium]